MNAFNLTILFLENRGRDRRVRTCKPQAQGDKTSAAGTRRLTWQETHRCRPRGHARTSNCLDMCPDPTRPDGCHTGGVCVHPSMSQ